MTGFNPKGGGPLGGGMGGSCKQMKAGGPKLAIMTDIKGAGKDIFADFEIEDEDLMDVSEGPGFAAAPSGGAVEPKPAEQQETWDMVTTGAGSPQKTSGASSEDAQIEKLLPEVEVLPRTEPVEEKDEEEAAPAAEESAAEEALVLPETEEETAGVEQEQAKTAAKEVAPMKKNDGSDSVLRAQTEVQREASPPKQQPAPAAPKLAAPFNDIPERRSLEPSLATVFAKKPEETNGAAAQKAPPEEENEDPLRPSKPSPAKHAKTTTSLPASAAAAATKPLQLPLLKPPSAAAAPTAAATATKDVFKPSFAEADAPVKKSVAASILGASKPISAPPSRLFRSSSNLFGASPTPKAALKPSIDNGAGPATTPTVATTTAEPVNDQPSKNFKNNRIAALQASAKAGKEPTPVPITPKFGAAGLTAPQPLTTGAGKQPTPGKHLPHPPAAIPFQQSGPMPSAAAAVFDGAVVEVPAPGATDAASASDFVADLIASDPLLQIDWANRDPLIFANLEQDTRETQEALALRTADAAFGLSAQMAAVSVETESLQKKLEEVDVDLAALRVRYALDTAEAMLKTSAFTKSMLGLPGFGLASGTSPGGGGSGGATSAGPAASGGDATEEGQEGQVQMGEMLEVAVVAMEIN